MQAVYFKNVDGLRIKAAGHTLVSGQLFYIIADGLNNEKLVFLISEACAKYFEVSAQTINTRITSKLAITNKNNIKFLLKRKSII